MTVEPDEKVTGASTLNPEAPVLLILLGASNLARGVYALAEHIKAGLHPRPVEVMIAVGPGRAYQASGGLFNVVYPPIQSSPLFKAAREKSETGYRLLALVTDLGNDIMYGVPVEELIETVQQMFVRLQAMNAEIFVTTLPVAFERRAGAIRFKILRTLLFPGSRVSYEEATAAVIEVNRFLRESAHGSVHRIPGMDSYLGLDGIHYSLFSAHRAWTHVARAMLEFTGMESAGGISRTLWIKSYWEGLCKLVGSDIFGFKNKKSNIY